MAGRIRRSKTGLIGSWQPTMLHVTNTTTAFGYTALSDHPEPGMGGLLWENILCPPGVASNNCTCGGHYKPPKATECVQKQQCAGCMGAIVFTKFPLEF